MEVREDVVREVLEDVDREDVVREDVDVVADVVVKSANLT